MGVCVNPTRQDISSRRVDLFACRIHVTRNLRDDAIPNENVGCDNRTLRDDLPRSNDEVHRLVSSAGWTHGATKTNGLVPREEG